MSGVPVARILGFEIRLPLSWLFIVAIVTVTVAGRMSAFQPDVEPLIAWGIGLVGSLGFLVTVIAHELAHAVVARRDGNPSRVLVVSFIGAPAAIDDIASNARAEAEVAIAGPLASLVIGAILVGVAYVLIAISESLAPVADVFLIVGVLDLILAVVSMVPAFPLEGARFVRAIAWARTGSQRRGTRAAGQVGRFFGRALIIAAFVIVVAGDVADGVMIGLIGWFLMASSRAVDRYLVLDALIDGVRVDEAMEQDLSTLTPQLTLDTFASEILDGTVGPALPVVDHDAVIGMVGLIQIRAVPRRNWSSTRTQDVMVGGDDLPIAKPDDLITATLDRLRISNLDGLPVLDGTTLRGVITRRSIAAILHARANASGQAPAGGHAP